MSYEAFTFKAAVELVSPPSLVASVGPCLVAGALAVAAALSASSGFFGAGEGTLATLSVALDARSFLVWALMLACAVLMQCATNTINDYQDFKSGLDTAETILDTSDASLVYNHINPRSALWFAVGLLAAAAVCGCVVALLSSVALLAWGLVAAAIVVFYSAGPRPLNTLPVGELVSGVVMGGIISCATFYAMTLTFSAAAVAVSLVPVVGIAQIMQTNNTCDIERDKLAGRRTLPVCLGQRRSAVLNAALSWVALVWLAVVLVWFGLYAGLALVVVGAAVCLPKTARLLRGPYNLVNRRVMMGTVTSYNRWLMGSAAAALLVGGACVRLMSTGGIFG